MNGNSRVLSGGYACLYPGCLYLLILLFFPSGGAVAGKIDRDLFKRESQRYYQTPSGEITGTKEGDRIRLWGIPYAQASRFGRPVPAPDHEEPFGALSISPCCPQHSGREMDSLIGVLRRGDLMEEEECQNLTVTLPEPPGRQLFAGKLPVMVFIHGGSYVSGAGDLYVYDPQLLVEEQHVIVVNVTYRLGILGFLGGYDERPANLGMLDVIEALRWVKRNISALNGDPDNITLFGHSSGADIVANLLIAKGAEGLFRRAIIQSAPLGITTGRREMTEEMIKIARHMPEDLPVPELLTWQDSAARAGHRFGLRGGMPYGLQYGYDPLPAEEELDRAWRKAATKYEVLIGNTTEEAALFVPLMDEKAHKLFGMPVAGALIRKKFVRTLTRKMYAAPSRKFAKRHKKGGGKAWYYTISWGERSGAMGAAHGIDVPLIFGSAHFSDETGLVAGIPHSDQTEDGRAVRALWAQFARTGELRPKGKLKGVIRYRRM